MSLSITPTEMQVRTALRGFLVSVLPAGVDVVLCTAMLLRLLPAWVLMAGLVPAMAEGWDTDDPDLASWFANEVVHGCCDQRDAYLADQVDGDGENIIAVITDGSPNERYSKPAIPNGTRIIVPRDRIKLSPAVPGGHAVIFLSKDSRPPEERAVYCYFPRALY